MIRAVIYVMAMIAPNVELIKALRR